MSTFDALNVSGSALTAQRLRMDTIASNLANANTTRTDKGTPFRREMVVFEAKPSNRPGLPGTGVHVAGIVEDQAPFRLVYDPGHPDANQQGYVAFPNVNPVAEMTDMISATRSYEANVTVVQALKGAANKALEI
ncbi:MAG TPA: flagellar basal body rod protein FlgC [Pantanalinema sp.]